MIASIVERAAEASPVWGRLGRSRIDETLVHGPRVDPRLALGVETIYEGYLVHHGTSRAFAPADRAEAILLGDYLYAAGLVEICRAGDLGAIGVLAELIAGVSADRARGLADDSARWRTAAEALA